jgi:hypothetical protein
MHRYKIYNAAMATTAVMTPVATGTSIKTMLQLAAPATRKLTVLAWGWSIDQAENGQIELLETGTVAATVTAHVASGVQPLDAGIPASLLTLGTAATGYTASAEGTITASRMFDHVIVEATASGSQQCTDEKVFTPAERPVVSVSSFLRVRAKMNTTTNMLCWVAVAE